MWLCTITVNKHFSFTNHMVLYFFQVTKFPYFYHQILEVYVCQRECVQNGKETFTEKYCIRNQSPPLHFVSCVIVQYHFSNNAAHGLNEMNTFFLIHLFPLCSFSFISILLILFLHSYSEHFQLFVYLDFYGQMRKRMTGRKGSLQGLVCLQVDEIKRRGKNIGWCKHHISLLNFSIHSPFLYGNDIRLLPNFMSG